MACSIDGLIEAPISLTISLPIECSAAVVAAGPAGDGYLQEDGSSFFLLEDGSTFLILE